MGITQEYSGQIHMQFVQTERTVPPCTYTIRKLDVSGAIHKDMWKYVEEYYYSATSRTNECFL